MPLVKIVAQGCAITQALASVAPLVNTTSDGLAPTRRATLSRAASTMRAGAPSFRVHRRRIADDIECRDHRGLRFAAAAAPSRCNPDRSA